MLGVVGAAFEHVHQLTSSMKICSLLFTVRQATIFGVITGAHTIIYTREVDAVRDLFRDVLGFTFVDAGGGWLIFALPPAELAAHPADEADRYELFLMCDDVYATVEELESKGIELSRPISDEEFGLLTAIKLPGGGELGLYEPRHSIPSQTG